jgi:hypothetical protein
MYLGAIIFISLFSNFAFGHEDHFLGNGMGHSFFHLLFFALLITSVFKGIKWWRERSSKKKHPKL